MTSPASMLILSYSNLKTDSRVCRHIKYFGKHYNVSVAGLTPPPMNVPFFQLLADDSTVFEKAIRAVKLFVGLNEEYYWSLSYIKDAYDLLCKHPVDVVVANDLQMLPLACKLAESYNAALHIDAHEYAPRQFDNSLYFKVFFQRLNTHIAKTYLSLADSMSTVTDRIAQEYKKNFKVDSVVLRNVLPYVDLTPSKTSGDDVRLVHIGICNRHRGLSGIIDLMKKLDSRFSLDFILIPEDKSYYTHLVNKSAADDRIKFLSPVAQNQICTTLNNYDIGVYPQSPKSFNYLNGLPNKFFEFIQARLGVAIWPIPEMEKLVQQYQNGIVSSEFSLEELAGQLNVLTREDIDRLKHNSSRCAEENSAEKEYLKMYKLLDERLKQKGF